MNDQLFQAINQFAGKSVWLDGLMIFFADYSPELFALFLALLWFSPKRNDKHILENNQRTVIYSLITLIVAFLCNQVIHLLYFHPRPFVTQTVNQLIEHSATESSFVSDHTILVFAISGMFFLQKVPYRGLVGVLAVITGVSRIFVGVHYPADVVGGAIIALIVALVIHKSSAMYEPFTRLIFRVYAVVTDRVPFLSAYRVYSTKQQKLYSQL